MAGFQIGLVRTRAAGYTVAMEDRRRTMLDAAAEPVAPGIVRVCWQARDHAEVFVYAGKPPERFDRKFPAVRSDEGCARVGGLDPAVRDYFALKANGDRLVTAERRLAMEGALNFRDLAGPRRNLLE